MLRDCSVFFWRSKDKEIDVSSLNIYVPANLLFSKCRRMSSGDMSCQESYAAKATSFSMSRIKRHYIAVRFSNGEILQFRGDASFRSGKGCSLRNRIALKSLGAWMLAALQERQGGLMRKDYERLQESTVLDAVTPDSLHDLASQVGGIRNRFCVWRRIAWDETNKRFVLGECRWPTALREGKHVIWL